MIKVRLNTLIRNYSYQIVQVRPLSLPFSASRFRFLHNLCKARALKYKSLIKEIALQFIIMHPSIMKFKSYGPIIERKETKL